MLGFLSLVPTSMIADTLQHSGPARTPSIPSSSDGQPSWLVRAGNEDSPGYGEVSKGSGCDNNSYPFTADVAQLASRVQRRLAQNRAAARKCRQKKKTYLHELEQEVAALRKTSDPENLRGLDEAGSGFYARTVVSQATLSQNLSELHKLQAAQCRTACCIREYLESNASHDNLRPLVDEALAEMQAITTLKEEMFNGPDMLLLAAGEHLSPPQRMICWMGGTRPTEMLRLMGEEWQIESLSTQQEQLLARRADLWYQQEEAISKGFEALRADVLALTCKQRVQSQDQRVVPPQLQGKLGAMRMLLLEALELHHVALSAIEEIVNLRQFAAILIKPMELCMNLQKVWERLHDTFDQVSLV